MSRLPRPLDVDSGGAIRMPGVPQGLRYTGGAASPLSTTTAVTNPGYLWVVPWLVPERLAWTKAGIDVTTTTPAFAFRMGLYSNIRWRPGALLHDLGAKTVASGLAAGPQEMDVAAWPEPGWYFMAVEVDAAVTLRHSGGLQVVLPYLSASGTLGVNDPILRKTQAYGALPDPFGAPNDSANTAPVCFMRW